MNILKNLNEWHSQGWREVMMPDFLWLYRAFSDYESWNGGLSEIDRTALRQQGQTEWAMTNLAKRQRKKFETWLSTPQMAAFFATSPITHIVDLGCGDGHALSVLLSNLPVQANRVVITLVETNEIALAQALTRLSAFEHMGFIVRPINCDMSDSTYWSDLPISTTLIMATSSLHEVDYKAKEDILRRARAINARAIIVELSSNHELLVSDSKILYANAARFYNGLIEDAYLSTLEPQRKNIVGAFLLNEFLDILYNEYSGRGNYHLDCDGWTKLIHNSGSDIDDTQYLNQIGEEPMTCFFAVAG